MHFFDLLIWLFGGLAQVDGLSRSDSIALRESTPTTSAGMLTLPRAVVRWDLSIDARRLPPAAHGKAFREITVDGRAIDFSAGFDDLHTLSYAEILAGRGFRAHETRAAVRLAHDLRA